MTLQIKSKPGRTGPLKKILSNEKCPLQPKDKVLHGSQQEEYCILTQNRNRMK